LQNIYRSFDLDFGKTKSQAIAAVMLCPLPCLSILQNETGLALAYSSFFIVMYREGLPGIHSDHWFFM
jgi:rod shape determining protein RodA